MQSLSQLGNHYFVEEPAHKRTMCLEIGLESTRNPKRRGDLRSVDRYVHESFEKLFAALESRGPHRARRSTSRRSPRLFSVIGDGMFMRRALDPDFDTKALVPAVMELIGKLLNVQPEAAAQRTRLK